MNRHVSEALRQRVRSRAGQVCEYCLMAIADTFFGGEVDHIVSVKHGGPTAADNLAYACHLAIETKGVISDRSMSRQGNWSGFSTRALITGQPILPCMTHASTR
jgi:hypothetical protein